MSPYNARMGGRRRGAVIATAWLSKLHGASNSFGTQSQRLVVLACEVGGRWGSEACDLLRRLVRVRSLRVPPPCALPPWQVVGLHELRTATRPRCWVAFGEHRRSRVAMGSRRSAKLSSAALPSLLLLHTL